jgi:hypothetical protein
MFCLVLCEKAEDVSSALPVVLESQAGLAGDVVQHLKNDKRGHEVLRKYKIVLVEILR